jgi:hypothetical protein
MINEVRTKSFNDEGLNFTQHDEDQVFKFDPPLYIQRYHYISKLINEFNVKTYLDIG